MRTPSYHASTLDDLFKAKTVCRLGDMMHALGAASRITVIRKLA
ncbi:MAG: hypothetical protein OXE78_14285 [Gammaproteobacteria bacterium]|nr:hypothetical protein [Gammaproteobacteria bacterium]